MDKEQLLPELPKPEFDVCELSYTAQVYTAEQMKEYALAAVSRVSAEGMQEQPEGYVLVPKSALDWLNGEHPDGFEPPADQKLFRGKIPPYWWRSEFRRRIAAAPPAVQETAQPDKPLHRIAKGWQQCPRCDRLHAELSEDSPLVKAHRQAEKEAKQLSISEEQIEDERPAFDEWAQKNLPATDLRVRDAYPQAWEAWQARALLNKKTEV